MRGDDFWGAVSSHYRELVRTTQPVYEKSEQAQIIADRRGLTRSLLFYGQRLSMVNQLFRDWDKYKNATNVEEQVQAARQVRFSMVNVLLINASVMSLVGMARAGMRDMSKELWGEDEEEPDEKSLMGVMLRGMATGVATQNVQLTPYIAELSEVATAPWRAARGPIVGDTVNEMTKVTGSIKRYIDAEADLDSTRPFTKKRARVEERMEDSLKSLANSSSKLAAFVLGVPARGIRDVVTGVSGSIQGIKDITEKD